MRADFRVAENNRLEIFSVPTSRAEIVSGQAGYQISGLIERAHFSRKKVKTLA